MYLPGKYVLDRFEGDKAVLLFRDDETIEVIRAKSELPEEAAEGDILLIEFKANGSVAHASLLREESDKAREKAKLLLEKLKRR
jgi:hypothetical protein